VMKQYFAAALLSNTLFNIDSRAVLTMTA